jgi:1,2-diacylglycerol 3-alpha-glucosyltransferase
MTTQAEPMRVLLASESYLPYLSGVTVSVDSLARGLGERGHDVLVLAPRPAAGSDPGDVGSPGPAPRHAWLGSYQLPAVVPTGYRMPWPNPWSSALSEARDFRPDVIHAHSPFLTGLLAVRLARQLGVPLVFTHHTRFGDYGHYLGALAGVASRMTDAYLRRFWRACAAIVAPSEDLARDIRARLPARMADRVAVIPTGIDVAGIRALDPVDSRAEAGWPEDTVVVASLGRLAPEKSPDLLLEAMALAAARRADLRLLVIGGGPSAEALGARAARPDLAGRVHMSGPLPRRAALARLRGADLFAFTSRTETQGLVLAEALAAGLPAVAVEGPGVGESVRGGIDGTVVAHDPAASLPERLADAIVDAAEPARRLALAERALADATRFAIDRRLAEVEALYARLQAH